MKILITTDLYTTDTNGVVTSVKNLQNELVKLGHDVRVLTLSENRHSRKDGMVHYIRSMPFGIYPDVRMPLSYNHKLIKELIEWKPDVIHSQCEFFSFQFAKKISKKTGAPIIHTYHTMYEHYTTYVIPGKKLGLKLLKVVLRNRLKKVDMLVAPTRKVERSLRGFGLENPISVIPTGINLGQHHLRITEEERLAKRRELGIADSEKVLINLGRLGYEKNVDELITFYAKASKDNDTLRFMIVGDGPARESLRKRASELGVSEKVIFTGMVDPHKVQEYYQLGDVFVSASTSETQGLTYVEAAANGLPLLCRYDDCLEDVIRQGENGYTYTSDEEFFESINAIASNPEWLGSAGKLSEEIATTFDKEVFAGSIEKIYSSLIAQ